MVVAGIDSGSGPADDGRPGFCERAGADAVRDVFCGEQPAAIRSLRELESRLGLDYASSGFGDTADAGAYGTANHRVVALGHSTALSSALVSPINPRVIVIAPSAILAFDRGIQEAEVVSRDRDTLHFNFYLVTFEQECNRAHGGCTPGDLYTPRIESGWTQVRVQDAEELKNTPLDCRQCHQRGRDTPLLLMRELEGPWTHFFAPDQGGSPANYPEPSGADLVTDYLAAKGSEAYGGIPANTLRATLGITLQGTVEVPQPLVFDASTILSERFPGGAHSEPVRSPTWDRAYAAFKRGETLPLPYFASRPTDPGKQAALTAAYQRYRANEIDAEDLPDLADIFPDDPQVRAEIGLQTEPGATGPEALVQACGSCHNDVLDQSISRARFNIDLARMDRPELDLAIARVNLARGEPGSMPPAGRRQLDGDGRQGLVEFLRRDARSPEDDAFLGRAAALGMAGGVPSGN